MSKYDYFIAIDAGRYANLALTMDEKGNQLESIRCDNNHQGCAMLIERLSKLKSKALIGIEGKGVCSNILLSRLAESNFTIKAIAPINVKRHKDYFTQPVKDDEYDAYATADYLRLRYPYLKDLNIRNSQAFNALKELSGLYKNFAQQKTAYINRLHHAVMEIFPEYITDGIFSKINCKSSLALLSELPTPRDITVVSFKRLKTVIAKNSRGHIGDKQIRRLYSLAHLSLCKALDYPASALKISALSKMILYLQTEQLKIRRLLATYLKEVPQAEILLSLPGVSTVLGSRFLSATGPLDRFDDSDGLALYCGVACLNDKSGLRNRSKRAYRVNHTAKDALMQIANCSLRFNPASKAFYERKRREGKRHWQAVKSLARNIIRVIYAMLKNDTKYNPEIYKNTRQIAVLS